MNDVTTVPKNPILPPIPRLIAAILPVMLVAMVGSLSTGSNVEEWYTTIEKPSFNPPNWVFPVTWAVLYVTIAVSLWRLLGTWPITGSGRQAWWWALAAFLAQLVLNAAWTPVFFTAHDLAGSLAIALAMLTMILWTIRLFWRFDRYAAWLLMPYAAWIAFACLLNGAIWQMN